MELVGVHAHVQTAFHDINAWSTGIVKKAEDYEWCSFAAAVRGGDPAVAERILELLADGPMRTSELRDAVGIRGSAHFNRYYLAPMTARGLIVRTDPDQATVTTVKSLMVNH